jgi:3-hydroxyisobutyrate dehydrogenase-like beta-hydroxyacid dehydrogenase
MKTKVGFVGLGLMGSPMATNIARAGYPLTVYDLAIEKCLPLKDLGAQVAASPKEVAECSDVVIAMLSDSVVMEKVLFSSDGVLAGAKTGLVFINMGTIAPEDTRRASVRLSEQGIKMLDAPVAGSTGHAKEGTLGILVGGEEQVYQTQKELLGALGKDIYYLGPSGSGEQMKLSMNLLVASQVTALSEAMVMAAKAGLDLELVGRIIGESNLASNLISRKIPNIVNRNFKPAFSLKLMQKDLTLIIQSGENLGVALPTTSVTHQLYNSAKTRGHGEDDSSSIYCVLAEMAGLD